MVEKQRKSGRNKVGVIASGLAQNPTFARLNFVYFALFSFRRRAISGDAKRRHLYQDIARLTGSNKKSVHRQLWVAKTVDLC